MHIYNCDKTQKLGLWPHSKTQMVTKPSNSNCNKTQTGTKLKNSNFDKILILLLWQNLNSNKNQTKIAAKLNLFVNSQTQITTKLKKIK